MAKIIENGEMDSIVSLRAQARCDVFNSVFGYSYAANHLTPIKEVKNVLADLSWQMLESGVTFHIHHSFETGKLEDLHDLAKNVTFALNVADSAVFRSNEVRRKIGIQPLGITDPEFWQLYSQQINSLRGLLFALLDKLETKKEDEIYQAQVTVAVVITYVLENLQRYAVDTNNSQVRFETPPISQDQLKGLAGVHMDDDFKSKVRSRVVRNDEKIAQEDFDKVLSLLEEYVRFGSLPTLYEKKRLDNIRIAASHLRQQEVITRENLDECWQLLMKDIYKYSTGYREKGIQLVEGREIENPTGIIFQNEFGNLLVEINSAPSLSGRDDSEKYVIAAKICAKFQELHPMKDGNGRLGHLVTNWVLSRLGLSNFAVPLSHFKRYVEAVTAIIQNPQDTYYLVYLMKTFSVSAQDTE